MKFLRLCVFCGSKTGDKEIYAASARRLGELMALRGIGLVYGGGHIGLMGILADAVLAAGGEAIGVIPQNMIDKELAHGQLTKLHVVSTMHPRKARMPDLADGFAALPGGFGTADELFEILTWAQLGIHTKPVALLDLDGFFDPLIAWINACVEEEFLSASNRDLLMVAQEP